MAGSRVSQIVPSIWSRVLKLKTAPPALPFLPFAWYVESDLHYGNAIVHSIDADFQCPFLRWQQYSIWEQVLLWRDGWKWTQSFSGNGSSGFRWRTFPRFYEGRSSILILYHVFRWSGAFILIVLFFFAETRSTIVLQKIAKQMRKKTGDKRYKARVEKPKMRTLIWISCTRPLSML